MKTQNAYDVVVVGGGSGGIGAAYSAARLGAKTLLVEKDMLIGGTFINAGVSCWESSISGTGLSKEIYTRLLAKPLSSAIYPQLHKNPLHDLTLKLNGLDIARLVYDPSYPKAPHMEFIAGRYGVIIEPAAYLDTVVTILRETGQCDIWTDTALVDASSENNEVSSITVRKNGKRCEVAAKVFIDATGDGVLCRQLACEMLSGSENHADFGELSAPPTRDPANINGVTLIFRVSLNPESWLTRPRFDAETIWEGFKQTPCWMRRFPNKDWYVNMLPTLKGCEFAQMDGEAAYHESLKRIWLTWEHMRRNHSPFENYNISWIAPRLGVRETSRVVCEQMLTEKDIRAGIEQQDYSDIVAIADHPFDSHGAPIAHTIGLLQAPYGISFRSLIPKGWKNLLVACRGAGFSHIAASSCRLSRTLMQLGQAAGIAACIASKRSINIPDIKYSQLRRNIEEQGIILDWQTLEQMYSTALANADT